MSMTKKDLIESLKNVPDDAVILAMQQWKDVCYGVYWGTDNKYECIMNIMQGVKYVPMYNQFKLSDYK